MTNLQKTNILARESLTIIKELISENDLVKGIYISDVRLNNKEDTIIIKDITDKKLYYSISEVSCIFTDNLDMLGAFDKCAYKTVLSSVHRDEYEKNKKSFMDAFLRLKQIETLV